VAVSTSIPIRGGWVILIVEGSLLLLIAGLIAAWPYNN
jgi:hypothetical protein